MSISISAIQIARAARLSTPTLYEAAQRSGALPSRLKPVALGLRLCGRAFPAFGPPSDNLWLHRAIYAAAPGDVLVFNPGGETETGYWGEVMTEAAKACHLAGLVIDGGVRDCSLISKMGFPVFASNVCIRGAMKDPHGLGGVGSSIVIGDVTISKGDLILGDDDGVVVLGPARIDETLTDAELRDSHELVEIERLRLGERTIDILGLGEAPQIGQVR